jgi:hypothetical protein
MNSQQDAGHGQPDVPASADKAVADDNSEDDGKEDGEEKKNEHEGPGGPRWTKFEDGAAVMQVDVESKEPDYSYTCKYISLNTPHLIACK